MTCGFRGLSSALVHTLPLLPFAFPSDNTLIAVESQGIWGAALPQSLRRAHMNPPANPSHIHDVLCRLRSYVNLLCQVQRLVRNDLPLLPTLQYQLEQVKCELPDHLVGYIHLLTQKSSLTPDKTITTLTRKECCEHCRSRVHPEWLELIALGEVIYICGGCGAVFVPPIRALARLSNPQTN